MFYSQFILAKKGPLGTIWIAAHLERKLRKNQVADTDIGLSVDSILFPEVPIALRLSSHLLLGVVRIYSKKVNYLFHDCSEALVKIKHAFRSTAVDLRPEESTAPYHSITLPETFDLDNFELPESALLSSNFVDHHVSTREQITLQDTLNGTSLPTSMFGLDERFGDGDASHIGLELEQELFMDKHFSPLRDSFSIASKDGVLHGEPSLPSTSLGNGQLSYNEGNCSGIPNELSELLSTNHDREGLSSLEGLRRNEESQHRHSYSIHTPDLNEVFTPGCQMAPSPYIALTPEEVQTPRLIEPVQGPSTPGLLEEVLPSNFQEIPPLSPQERAATPAGPGRPWTSSGPFMEIEYPEARNETSHTDSPAMDHCSVGTAEGLSSSVVFEQRSGSLALTHLDEILTTHNSCLPYGTENAIGKSTSNEVNDLSVADQLEDNREVVLPSAFSDETGKLESHINLAAFSGAVPLSSNFSTDNVNKVDISGSIGVAKITAHNCTEPSNMSNLGHSEDDGSCISRNTSAIKSAFHLKPCSSNLHQDETLVEISDLSRREQFCSLELPFREEAPHMCESLREVQGDDFHPTNFGVSNLEQQQKPESTPSGVKSGFIEPHELSICGPSEVIQPDRVNHSSSSEFLEPEKIIASTHNVDFPNNRGQQIADKGVAESDGSVDRISTLYSNKHQVIDITTVHKTGSAAKLSGVKRNWRNTVPDDDDLLASILVGRKSQFSKIGTPLSPSTASSSKRLRTMPKVGNLKRRKVLVDDTMFLHADTIRQQLMNTEDIRRTRKKAPCTRPDIWRIHIYEAEDEIFKYSVLTGLTSELNSLECQRYSRHVKLSPQVKNQNSHVNASEEANSCRTSLFVNESDAKILEESALTSWSLDHVGDKVPSVINEGDMEQVHKDGKLFVVKEQFEPSSVRPQMEPLNEGPNLMMFEMESVVRGGLTVLGDSMLTPLSLDHLGDNGGSAMCGADIVQTHEDVKQLVVKEQIEQISVRPQMELLNESPDSLMSEMEAVAWKDSHLRTTGSYATENAEICPPLEKHDNESINDLMMSEMEVDSRGGFHLTRTEAYIAENAENCLPLEKTDDMEQSQHPEGLDHHQTISLDGLEQITMEIDNSAAVFIDSECLNHTEEESNALGTENSRCPQTCLSHCTEIDEASVSERGVTADDGAELLEETIVSAVAGECCNLKALENDGQSMPDTACTEVERMASSSIPTEYVLFTVEGISAVQEHNLEAGLHLHENPIDIAAARDSSDFCGAIDDNYADLLNVDDEADLDIAEDVAHNPESAKLLENSGWSVRTRGVAKYLKNLFYEESVSGRTVAVDRLLYGKTRKEASRMFFETLVLKSRDYIQVEQETPFAHVYIKPRIKLLESEF